MKMRLDLNTLHHYTTIKYIKKEQDNESNNGNIYRSNSEMAHLRDITIRSLVEHTIKEIFRIAPRHLIK